MLSARFSRSPLAAVMLKLTAATIIGTVPAACGEQEQPPAIAEPAAVAKPENVAKKVVADFLSLPMDDVSLVSLEAIEFNDSSLGCPEPGMSYLQALTPGYRVVLEADGRRFDVRVSAGHGRICHRRKPPGAPADESADRAPVTSQIDLARQDLARLLGTESTRISVVGIRSVNTRTVVDDCSLNCEPGAEQCGYIIALLHDGRRYDYHADQEVISPCTPILTM
jgi:hypothetical protein